MSPDIWLLTVVLHSHWLHGVVENDLLWYSICLFAYLFFTWTLLPPVINRGLCNVLRTFCKYDFKWAELGFYKKNIHASHNNKHILVTSRTNLWHSLIDLIVPIRLWTNLHNKIGTFSVSAWQIVFRLGNILFITVTLVFEYQQGCCCLTTRGASIAGVKIDNVGPGAADLGTNETWCDWCCVMRCSFHGESQRRDTSACKVVCYYIFFISLFILCETIKF